VASDFGEGPFDANDAFLRLVAVDVEGDEFPDAAAGVGGGDDEGPVAGVDGVGEVGDLVRREEPLLGVVVPWQGDVATRAAGDEPGCDRIVTGPSEELVGLADGGRRVAVGVEVGDPFLDVEGTDGADWHVGEGGQDETAQI